MHGAVFARSGGLSKGLAIEALGVTHDPRGGQDHDLPGLWLGTRRVGEPRGTTNAAPRIPKP